MFTESDKITEFKWVLEKCNLPRSRCVTRHTTAARETRKGDVRPILGQRESQTPKFLNYLSPEITGSSSLASFRKKLKSFIIINYLC